MLDHADKEKGCKQMARASNVDLAHTSLSRLSLEFLLNARLVLKRQNALVGLK